MSAATGRVPLTVWQQLTRDVTNNLIKDYMPRINNQFPIRVSDDVPAYVITDES